MGGGRPRLDLKLDGEKFHTFHLHTKNPPERDPGLGLFGRPRLRLRPASSTPIALSHPPTAALLGGFSGETPA